MTLIYSIYSNFAIPIPSQSILAATSQPRTARATNLQTPIPSDYLVRTAIANARHTTVPETEGAHQAWVAGLRALGRPDDARAAGRWTGLGVSFATCDARNLDGRTMGLRLAWLNRRYHGRGVYRTALGMLYLNIVHEVEGLPDLPKNLLYQAMCPSRPGRRGRG